MGKNSYICGKCKNCGTYLCNICDGTDRFVEDLGKYKKTDYTNVRKETTMSVIDRIEWRVEGIELNNKYLEESNLRVTLNGYPTDLRVTQHDLMTLDRVIEQRLNGRPKMNYYPANPCYGITKPKPFTIKKVIFNDPATIVFWEDGTKTVVKAKDETFDPEKGLAMAFSKKMFGNKGNYFEVFKKYCEPYEEKEAKEAAEEKMKNEAQTIGTKVNGFTLVTEHYGYTMAYPDNFSKPEYYVCHKDEVHLIDDLNHRNCFFHSALERNAKSVAVNLELQNYILKDDK